MQSSNFGKFSSTSWTLVFQAASQNEKSALEALDEICRNYWPPLYALARHKGLSPQDAEDAVQTFFSRLCEKKTLENVSQDRGKLRSYFATIFQNQLIDEHRSAANQKRKHNISLQAPQLEQEEDWLAKHIKHDITPEKLFDKRWTLTLLEQVLHNLKQHYQTSGKESRFEHLRPFLQEEGDVEKYESIAEKLGTSLNAIVVAVSRLRRQYHKLLRAAVSQLLEDQSPDSIEEEIRELLSALTP